MILGIKLATQMEDAYDQAIQYMQRSEQLQKGVIEQQQRDA